MELIQLRRELHQIAELSFEEYKTQEYIENYFKNHHCQIRKYLTSIVIIFNELATTAIGFRAEEDALPIQEKNSSCFISKTNMHACGHDGHMAMLIKLGDYINDNLDKISSKIVLIFQMGEEKGDGALKLIQSGILSDIDFKHIYAIHLYPGLKEGIFFAKKGVMLANCTEISITFLGKSSHVAQKHLGIDANEAAYLFLKEIKRNLKSNSHYTYLFGTINGGVGRNIVSSKCSLEGTIRTFYDSDLKRIKQKILKIANQIKKKTGASFEIKYNDNFHTVINDIDLFNKVKSLLDIKNINAQLIGDDFCHYHQLAPSLYLLLGVDSFPLHSEYFSFNEKVLYKGLDMLIKLLDI